jgi:nitrogen fixation protein FixH
MGAMSMGEDYYGISRTAKLVLQTDLTPARTGENTMLFTVLSKDGRPQPVQAWTASLTRQSPAPAQALAIQVIPMVQGIARAAPTIPSAGTWVVDVRASTSDQQTISLRWTVTVTP